MSQQAMSVFCYNRGESYFRVVQTKSEKIRQRNWNALLYYMKQDDTGNNGREANNSAYSLDASEASGGLEVNFGHSS